MRYSDLISGQKFIFTDYLNIMPRPDVMMKMNMGGYVGLESGITRSVLDNPNLQDRPVELVSALKSKKR
jgi:hypothetical protein